ncbi:BMA-INA-1, isoform a [Dirofilaria immitis]|nr:BMA-INA-1, isoform a [Dirofilaria immitis]
MVYYLIYYYYCSVVLSFNLDIHAPIYKIGPNNSYFGFSVAEHFKENLPVNHGLWCVLAIMGRNDVIGAPSEVINSLSQILRLCTHPTRCLLKCRVGLVEKSEEKATLCPDYMSKVKKTYEKHHDFFVFLLLDTAAQRNYQWVFQKQSNGPEYLKDSLLILVGAPKAESGQPGTEHAGAVYSCSITARYTQSNGASATANSEWCQQENVEYGTINEMHQPVDTVLGRQLHYQGKNKQLLGSVVASAGIPNGMAMACAPLVRYHNSSAYTDGTCFVLESDLTQKEIIVSCSQPGLPLN